MECIELHSGIQLKNLIVILYYTLTIPILAGKNILCFTIVPYSYSLLFDSTDIMNNYHQGGSTEVVKDFIKNH